VDGEDNTPSNVSTQRFYEVQKYLTVSNHTRLTYALVTSSKFWNSLPADVKPAMERAVKETTAFFNSVAAQDNDDAMAKIKAAGKTEIHVLTPDEKKAWVAKMMTVHKDMESRFSKDFIQKIYDASGFTPPTS